MKKVIDITLVVFFTLLAAGYYLSTIKPVSNDELYTQVSHIDGLTYSEILTAKIAEGNVSPLFYLSQKLTLDLLNFHLPFEWKGDWFVEDRLSQVMMRIMPNVWMSLSVAFIFLFFSRVYSLGAGMLSLVMALSSYMVWDHWVEARPYALWVLLSTAQFLLVLNLLRQKSDDQRSWLALMITHYCLAFTVVLSAVQILAISLVLLFTQERRLQRMIFATVIPVGICAAYYFLSPKYSFFFHDSAVQLISANLPKDRILLVVLLAGILFAVQRKKSGVPFFFLGVFILLLALSGALMLLFAVKAAGAQDGFPISNRYLIYLTPLGIIASTYFSVEVWRSLSGRIALRLGAAALIVIFILFRAQRTWELVSGLYRF